MKKSTRYLILLAIAGAICSCKSDVDFGNIDTRMQAEMGIAIPVGDMQFTTNDFLGHGQVKQICVDAEGIFHYVDSFDIPRRLFHPLDLSQYVGTCDKTFLVYDQLNENGYLDASGKIKDSKKGIPITLRFHINQVLKGVNQDVNNERIDSVQVSSAFFNSLVQVQNLNLDWSWINSLSVELNSQFRRPQGAIVPIYTKGDGYGYNQNIPVAIDDFTISLMNESAPNGVVDTCGYTFIFTFTVPIGQNVSIQRTTSSFTYHFETQQVEFKAAWGFFQASNQVRERDVVSVDSLWNDWANVKKLQMRIMEPEITLYASHQIAAPIIVYVDTLMATNLQGNKVCATWNGDMHHAFQLKNMLSPYSALTDSVWNSQTFNYQPENGHLDNLFDIRPDTLKYSFRMQIDPNRKDYVWKQHRITATSYVGGHVVVDVPFKVNTQSEVQYITKIENVDFSRINLDSLLSTVDIVEKSQAKHIKLFLTLENSLPFDVRAKIWFLEADSTIMDLHLVEGEQENEIHLPAPKMERNGQEKYGHVVSPSTKTLIIDVAQQQFDYLTHCKHLKLDAYMGSNPEPCQIDTASSIRVQLGVAADVQAIVNLQK